MITEKKSTLFLDTNAVVDIVAGVTTFMVSAGLLGLRPALAFSGACFLVSQFGNAKDEMTNLKSPTTCFRRGLQALIRRVNQNLG